MHSELINIDKFTTMQLPAMANVFYIKNTDEIIDFYKNLKLGETPFILGGGSNLIIAPTITNRPILKIEILGIQILENNNDHVLVKLGAGENWDSVVEWAVDNNYSGIEALSAIPGTVGATPVQNVGAYGSEIKDVFVSLNAYDTKNKNIVSLNKEQCNFSYRNSIFKTGEQKGRYIIIDITLMLSKNHPKVPEYKGVQEYFDLANNLTPSLSDIRNAIIEIRWSKLPNPETLPNCGSFFENPIIENKIAEDLKIKYPNIPLYPYGDKIKVSAGYLIDQSGLKGVDFGPIGVYEKTALVLVNRGGGTYDDLVKTKDIIIKTVYDKFGITLKPEPEFVN